MWVAARSNHKAGRPVHVTATSIQEELPTVHAPTKKFDVTYFYTESSFSRRQSLSWSWIVKKWPAYMKTNSHHRIHKITVPTLHVVIPYVSKTRLKPTLMPEFCILSFLFSLVSWCIPDSFLFLIHIVHDTNHTHLIFLFNHCNKIGRKIPTTNVLTVTFVSSITMLLHLALGPRIFFITLFSNSLNLPPSLAWQKVLHTQYKLKLF